MANEQTDPILTDVLTEQDIDVVGEILNISMGAAATALSAMLDRQVTITTPSLKQSTMGEADYSDMDPSIMVKINYVEGISGSNVIVFRSRDMQIILNLLMGNEELPPEDAAFEFDEMSMSAACEVMNQMMGSSATALSEVLGRVVNISTPTAHISEKGNRIASTLMEMDEKEMVACVSFRLMVEDIMDSDFISFLPLPLAREIISSVMPSDGPGIQPPTAVQTGSGDEAAQAAASTAVAPEPIPEPIPEAISAPVEEPAGDAYEPPDEPIPRQPEEQPLQEAEAPAEGEAQFPAQTEASPAGEAPGQVPYEEAAQEPLPMAQVPSEQEREAAQEQEREQAFARAQQAQADLQRQASPPMQAPPEAPPPQMQMPPPMAPQMQAPPQGPPEMPPPMQQQAPPGWGPQPQQYQQPPPYQQAPYSAEINTGQRVINMVNPMNQLNIKRPQFPDFSDQARRGMADSGNFALLMGVPLDVSIVIGKTRRKIKEILDFGQGTVLELEKQTGAPAEIIVNGQLLAYGDVIVIGDNFGVRITEIVGTKDLIDSLDGQG